MTTELFVYGTLMSRSRDDLGAEPRTKLSQSGTWLGQASVGGCLYDLGAYPGFTDSANPVDIVSGEVIRLKAPADTFAWLDLYEGIDPSEPQLAEYERTIRQIILQGQTIAAWIYLYRDPLPSNQLIASGRWLRD